jgi:hypothetical protein
MLFINMVCLTVESAEDQTRIVGCLIPNNAVNALVLQLRRLQKNPGATDRAIMNPHSTGTAHGSSDYG